MYIDLNPNSSGFIEQPSYYHKYKYKLFIYCRPGPWVEATKGEIWPKPKVQKSQPEFFSLRSSSFAFEVSQ